LRIKIPVDLDFNRIPLEDRVAAIQWLNLQHGPKEVIETGDMISAEHKEAGYNLHACRRALVEVEIGKDGNWKFVRFDG
jgi:hypothetical protein